jgi:hypothetical protein
MIRATWNGEAGRTVVVEGNHYFPPESVRKNLLTPKPLALALLLGGAGKLLPSGGR